MDSRTAGPEFADSLLRAKMASLGMAVNYVRAEGNTLYYVDETGSEVAVLDLVGSFGALILGHNNPDIVARAKEILDSRPPIFTLMLGHSHANEVATALNKIVGGELETDEPHYALFANTGAEAVEVSIKHAEIERQARAKQLEADISAHLETARNAVKAGAAVAGSAYGLMGIDRDLQGAAAFEALAAEVASRLTDAAANAPVFIALEGAFHGKLVASVQLTHSEGLRLPFDSFGPRSRFVPADRPDTIRKIVEEERVAVPDVIVEQGLVHVVERDYPIVGGFYVEPIRGEAGIHPVNPDHLRQIQQICEWIDCPIIVDEIQSGMGRTGTFLASPQMGLRGDYFILAKSLGGGLAKTSVVLIRERRYQSEMELLHSSTFAKDSFSCLIALKVLELLEADNGRAYRMAEERGTRLSSMLKVLWAKFPGVVKDVRGRGLMLGIEFDDQAGATDPKIREAADAGMLGFLIAAYLFRVHHIRMFPTVSAANTLRLEPSIHITDAEIDQAETALRDVCSLLRDQRGEEL